MEIRLILAALRKHRIAAALVALEITLSFAILCNAVFVIVQRLSAMRLPSGLAENELVYINIGAYRGSDADDDGIIKEHLAALRALPGVRSADAYAALPLSHDDYYFGVALQPGEQSATVTVNEYQGTPGIVGTLGLHLVAGRDFRDEDAVGLQSFLPTSPVAIVSQALAAHLWPQGGAVGKTFYVGTRRYEVIGVVDHLLQAEIRNPAQAEYTVLFAVPPIADIGGSYVLRVAAAERDRVLQAAAAALLQVSPSGIITEHGRYSEMRAAYFRQDRALAFMLVGACALMLLVTALGIVGLASFWVQSRRRAIGIRRALGATRLDVLRYFQIENLLIVSGGVALGAAAAYGLNVWLQTHFELAPLPWTYAALAAPGLGLLGQLAVLGPARRAAAVPPVEATRAAY